MIHLSRIIRHLVTGTLSLFYPSFCPLCDAAVRKQGRLICTSCEGSLERLKEPVCRKCASELPAFSDHSLCKTCRNEKRSFRRGYALFRYEHQTKELLHRVKFGKKSWYLKFLKSFLHDIEQAVPIESYDLIVPVPLDWKRKREREFNQTEVIASILLGSRTKPPVWRVIQKKRRTVPQSTLPREARLHNLEGAFCVTNKNLIRGKSVLLVDDIVTTGATVNECAKCLTDHGAKCVDFFALARPGMAA